MTVLHLPTRPFERVPYSRLSHEITTNVDTDLLMTDDFSDTDVVFRIATVVETIYLVERDGDRPHFTYVVSCRGPVQTSKGRDHGGRTTGVIFAEGYDNMRDLPAKIRMVLHGPDRMLVELQELLTEGIGNSSF